MEPASASIDAEIERHDRAVAALGLDLWLGGEPTFTDATSTDPEWIGAAVGPSKPARAARLVAELARDQPGAALLRTVGRRYPGEHAPRFSLGLYRARDGAVIWTGPLDPLLGGSRSAPGADRRLAEALAAALTAAGREASVVEDPASDLPLAVVWSAADACVAGADLAGSVAHTVRELGVPRVSVHRASPESLAEPDPWSDRGVRVVRIGTPAIHEALGVADGVPRAELPPIPGTAEQLALLGWLGAAAHAAGLAGLVLAGHPPPVDARVAWTTVTPDPGVIEVNMAPEPSLAAFHRSWRSIQRGAQAVGLAAERLHFNGDVSDSGGGGQITFGGDAPATSPFVLHPRLLPRLVSYVNRHPALSYAFAFDALGASSQAPRADEGDPEAVAELELALAVLARCPHASAEETWATLAPFLVDRFGNPHRAELNVEKLLNPHLGPRGRLGLVELRALAMPASPRVAASRAMLLRAVVASLVQGDHPIGLTRWGAELHDRFALPYYLARDLDDVLADLERAGVGLGPVALDALLEPELRVVGELEVDGVELTVSRALEFWPLVGDLSDQGGTARWMDSSTRRLEVVVRRRQGAPADAGMLLVEGHRVPLERVTERERDGAWVAVLGIRHRAFEPRPGLHPLLEARDPVHLTWWSSRSGRSADVALHGWRPDGGAYAGLPLDRAEAARRVAERFVARVDPPVAGPAPSGAPEPAPPELPAAAWKGRSVDTRWLPPR